MQLPPNARPRARRRHLLPLAAAVAAVAALPSAANAASICSADVLGQISVSDLSGPQNLRIARSGQLIGIADGAGSLRFCSGPRGLASVTNTSRIVVHEGGSDNTIFYDQSGGVLAPGDFPESDGNSEVELLVDGDADLFVTGTPGPDVIKATGGGGVLLGSDFDVDIRSRLGDISIDGRGGDDFLSGRGDFPVSRFGSAGRPLFLAGSLGNDTIVDGMSADTLVGGDGNDTLFSVDIPQPDFLSGGPGFDTATIDELDEVFDNSVEQLGSVSVGNLRLAPAVVHAKAGTVAHMKLSWTHPKSWKRLRKIEVRVYDAAELVQRIVVRPRHAERHGKTVTARLALRPPKSLADHQLRVDVEATDRRGHRQLEPSAGLLDL